MMAHHNLIRERYAQIAQLVEQRTENPRVPGSIPGLSIFTEHSSLEPSAQGAAVFKFSFEKNVQNPVVSTVPHVFAYGVFNNNGMSISENATGIR